LVDVTESDPSVGWAAGAPISTPSEVTEFFTALLGAELLSPAMLAEMTTTAPVPMASVRGDEAHGLSPQTFTPICGGQAWGHGGDFLGHRTRNAITTDGRSAVVPVTALPTMLEAAEHVEDAVDTAPCA
jgi:D-alanyl-D-alanine carboxypeptidase